MTALDAEPNEGLSWRWLLVLPALFVEYLAIAVARMVGEGTTIFGHDDGDPVAGIVIGLVGSLPLAASVGFAGGWIAVGCLGALAGIVAIAWGVATVSPMLLAAVVAVVLLGGRRALRNSS